MIFHVVSLRVKHARDEGYRDDVCCLQAQIPKEIQLCLGPHIPILSYLPPCRVSPAL